MTAYQDYFTRPVIKFIYIIWVTRVKGTSAGVFEILLKIDLPNIIFHGSFKTLISGFLFTIAFCLTRTVYPLPTPFTRDPRCLPATLTVYPRPAIRDPRGLDNPVDTAVILSSQNGILNSRFSYLAGRV